MFWRGVGVGLCLAQIMALLVNGLTRVSWFLDGLMLIFVVAFLFRRHVRRAPELYSLAVKDRESANVIQPPSAS